MEIDAVDLTSVIASCIKEFNKSIHKYSEKSCDLCYRLQYTLMGLSTAGLHENILQHFNPLPASFQLCKRCHGATKRRKVPSQAFCNGMKGEIIPEEISCLSHAEIQLISQVRPFMKIFYLSKGRGQQAIKGSAIHFPNSIKEICKELPLPNSNSEFIVVHEKIEGISHQRDFRVRQSVVLKALQWLKDNNWLYRNVTVYERDEIAMQPTTVSAVITQTAVPRKNISVSMLTYASLGANKRILRASCNQATAGRFIEAGKGKQCTAMSMTSIVFSCIQNPSTWTTDILDEILLRGDKWYHQKARQGQLLTAFEAQGSIDNIFGAISVTATLEESDAISYNGQLNRLASQITSQILRLPVALQTLIDSNYSTAVLTVGSYSMAILKYSDKTYLFDSHSRGPHGRVAANGLACVIEYPNSIAAVEISKLVHINLEPKQIPQSDEDAVNYLFSISPVNTATEFNCEHDFVPNGTNSFRRISQAATPMPVEDRLSNLLQDAAAFGENVMVDTLFHNVDFNVPDLQDIVPTATSNSTPSILIEKEKGRPMYPNQEAFLEELCFVNLFPFGTGGLSKTRPVLITPLDYFQARVMSSDTRYWDNSYLFYALNRMEENKVKQKIAVCGQIQTLGNDGCEYPGLTNVHLYMSAIRGSASYWKTYTGDLIAMIAQRGIPTIFLTISSDDFNSTDSLCGLLFADARRGNDNDENLIAQLRRFIESQDYSGIENAIKTLSYEKKSDLLNRHPVQAARHFHHRINIFLTLLKKCGKGIFGYELDDYSYRIEFQNRGSAHFHMLIWLKDAPKNYHSIEGRNLIESNMSCRIPNDDEELKSLVLKYQQHRHTKTCFPRTQFCRFDFPRKVSKETVILEEDDINRNKDRFCILKRDEHETFINNYQPLLLKVLKCNMDIQFVTDANAIAYYIAKYISKAEPTDIQDEIQKIMQNLQSNSKASYYQMATSIAMKILNKRQVSAPEAAYRLCHLKLRHSSRGFVFIPAYLPEKRLHLVQKETIGNSNIKMGLSIIEKYCLLPDSLVGICLLEFAAMYTAVKKDSSNDDIDDNNDNEEELFQSNTIRLNNGTVMKVRKRPAIVKYPNFDALSQPQDYYYSLMLLYYPFVDEKDITSGFQTIMEAFKDRSLHFRNSSHADFLRPNLAQEIDRALIRIQNFDDPLTPIVEGEDCLHFEIEDENVPEGEIFQQLNDVGNLHERYHSLSDEQKEVFLKVKRKLDGTETRQMLSFISGSGGTGKSYLIDTLASLIASYSTNGNNLLLKAAPTGMSALNINATTIHRAFKLPIQRGYIPVYSPLKSKQVEELRSALKHVKWIIMDEISMISYQSLRTIHLRLGEITNKEEAFGGLNVLVLGDLMQFRPINASWIFKPSNNYLHEVNLWKLFNFYELFTNHRQTGDTRYLQLLERLRFGQCNKDDLSFLESRIFKSDDLEDSELYSKFAEALFPTTNEVNDFNSNKTERLREDLAKINKKTYIIRAKDTYAAGNHFDEPCPERLIPKQERLTAGIPSMIEIGVGSRIMQRRNWSLTDGKMIKKLYLAECAKFCV